MCTYMTEVSAAYKHLFGFKKEKKQYTDNSTVTLRKTGFLTKHECPVQGPIIQDSNESSQGKPGTAPHQLRRPSPTQHLFKVLLILIIGRQLSPREKTGAANTLVKFLSVFHGISHPASQEHVHASMRTIL